MRKARSFAVALVGLGIVLVVAGLVASLLNGIVYGLGLILVGWFAAMSIEIAGRPRRR